jgi:outer membrane protein assembly factor BamB
MRTRRTIRSAVLLAALTAVAASVAPAGAVGTGAAWTTLGGAPERTFFNAAEHTLTAANVNTLVPKWRFPTVEPVTASPAVATIDVAGTPTSVVFDADFAGNLYAVDAKTGLPLWADCLVPGQPPTPLCAVAYPTNPGMQTDYGVSVDSPAVADVVTPSGAQTRVFEAADAVMYGVNAATGAIAWSFDAAGTSGAPNYEIESSPLVVSSSTGEQLVVFSIDCNAYCPKPGGIWAVDAADGHLVWFFDPVTGENYQPSSTSVHSFGPTDVGPKAAGPGNCGGIWASQSADLTLGLLYTATNDCSNASASPYFEAVFALHLDTGAPAWTYQPRNLDSADLDYGATPNVYTLGNGRHVVGEGSKDGTYSLLDAATGAKLWTRRLTVGGNFGGFYNGATDGARIYLTSSVGTLSGAAVTIADDAQKGRVFALDATTGVLAWSQVIGAPTFGQNMLVPGVYLDSGLDHAVHAYDTATGALLAVIPVGGAVSSTPVVAGGQMFVGANTGSTWRAAVGTGLNPIGFPVNPTAPTPIPIFEDGGAIVAYCLAADVTCQSRM